MPEKKKVTFRLKFPDATTVMLVGDFNHWSRNAAPMTPDETGRWRTTLRLVPGRYEFKFLVDGKWREPAANENAVRNRFGTRNNVVFIH
ncbi:MAG TPA: glycogen-binding domain-containing protein [Desulfobacterales bacterium]